MIFFRKKEKLALALDIGTEAVKAIIFSYEIAILGAGVSYLKYSPDNFYFSEEDLKNNILEAIESAKNNSFLFLENKDLKETIRRQKKWDIFLGLSPLIFKARVASTSYIRKKPKDHISDREEKRIMDDILEGAKKNIFDDWIPPKDIFWNSIQPIEAKIDGYPVSDINDYEGERLDFKVLATFLPSSYLEKIKKIFKDLGFKSVKLIHSAQSLDKIYRDSEKELFFIDIGGEVTQVLGIKKGVIQGISEFPIGSKQFTKSLSENIGIDSESAKIMKEEYCEGSLSSGVSQKIKSIFSQDKKNWQNGLEQVLTGTGYRAGWASSVLLLGGGSSLPEVLDVLTGFQFSQIDYLSIASVKIQVKNLKIIQIIPSLLICYGAKNL